MNTTVIKMQNCLQFPPASGMQVRYFHANLSSPSPHARHIPLRPPPRQTMKSLRKHADHRLFFLEFSAVFLWVIASLSTFVATNTPLLHPFAPSLANVPPLHTFLTMLVIVMALWELLGLSLGSPLNPAVTLALALAREIPSRHATLMAAAQFAAHVAGVLVVRAMAFAIAPQLCEGVFAPPVPHEEVSSAMAVGFEAGVTAVLCVLVLGVKDVFGEGARVKKWGVVTGGVVAALAVGGEWTGSCMNPALSFALAMMEGRWERHVVYWMGPLIGATIVGAGWGRFRRRDERKKVD